MQLAYQAQCMIRVDDQGQVQVVGGLGDHVHVAILEHIKCGRKTAQDRADCIADQADGNTAVVYTDPAKPFEIGQKKAHALLIVVSRHLGIEADRNRRLRG